MRLVGRRNRRPSLVKDLMLDDMDGSIDGFLVAKARLTKGGRYTFAVLAINNTTVGVRSGLSPETCTFEFTTSPIRNLKPNDTHIPALPANSLEEEEECLENTQPIQKPNLSTSFRIQFLQSDQIC